MVNPWDGGRPSVCPGTWRQYMQNWMQRWLSGKIIILRARYGIMCVESAVKSWPTNQPVFRGLVPLTHTGGEPLDSAVALARNPNLLQPFKKSGYASGFKSCSHRRWRLRSLLRVFCSSGERVAALRVRPTYSLIRYHSIERYVPECLGSVRKDGYLRSDVQIKGEKWKLKDAKTC